eukprot:gene19424-biopygen29797
MGTEAALHTVRQWCQRNASVPDKALLKLDFRNAFNTIDRSAVLRAGVQQDDPLGPLLFALALQPLVPKLAAGGVGGGLDFAQFYLDDGVLAGSIDAIAEALRVLRAEAPLIGLQLKLLECKLVSPSAAATPGDLHRAGFPTDLLWDSCTGEWRVSGGDFEYLGAPVGSAAHADAHIRQLVADLGPMFDALPTLPDPQVALRLQRQCLDHGKVGYLMRTVPSHLAERAFDAFDAATINCFTLVTGIAADPSTRARIHLLVGLRSAASHAPAAYIASRTQTRTLCAGVDGAFVWDPELPGSDLALTLAILQSSLPRSAWPIPTLPDPLKQKSLSVVIDAAIAAYIRPPGEAAQANLLSELQPGAEGFLTAQPLKLDELDLTFSPAEFVVSLRFRLGLP